MNSQLSISKSLFLISLKQHPFLLSKLKEGVLFGEATTGRLEPLMIHNEGGQWHLGEE